MEFYRRRGRKDKIEEERRGKKREGREKK